MRRSPPNPAGLTGDASGGGAAAEAGALASDPENGGAASFGGAAEAGAAASDPEDEVPYPEVVLADRPLAYWRLGELSGPTALDSAGNHPGEYQEDQGAIGYGVPGLVRGGDRAIQLSGAQGVVVGDHFSFAEGQPFSLEAWIRADTLDDEIRVVLAKPYRSETGEQGYSLAVRQQAGVRFWFARDDTFARIQASSSLRVAFVVFVRRL